MAEIYSEGAVRRPRQLSVWRRLVQRDHAHTLIEIRIPKKHSGDHKGKQQHTEASHKGIGSMHHTEIEHKAL